MWLQVAVAVPPVPLVSSCHDQVIALESAALGDAPDVGYGEAREEIEKRLTVFREEALALEDEYRYAALTDALKQLTEMPDPCNEDQNTDTTPSESDQNDPKLTAIPAGCLQNAP